MDQTTGQSSGPVPSRNNTAGAKQQVVGYLEGAKNVLVTVSNNPDVDELASALGLTLLLAKLNKHVTAVFSGEVPPAINFLDPEKTFENNVDSLRDFIIALDRDKADKLRYKVEDDVVRIFLTPHKTKLQKEDFEFSQGDFNVDVVVALGTQKRSDLDQAITAHGRILHDATIITISDSQASSLGIVDWTDANASSIAEMLVSISESFGSGLLDAQISTAFLTGLVSATNRFSNEKTSPKVMTMSAQLMAAGANQQLIASNLRREGEIDDAIEVRANEKSEVGDTGEVLLTQAGESDDAAKSFAVGSSDEAEAGISIQADPQESAGVANVPSAQGAASITPPASPVEDGSSVAADNPVDVSDPARQEPVVAVPDLEAADSGPSMQQPVASAVEPLPSQATNPGSPEGSDAASLATSTLPPVQGGSPKIIPHNKDRAETQKPMFGGTLNATTAHAEDQKVEQAAREAERNNVSLSRSQDTDPPAHDEAAAHDAIEEARRSVEAIMTEAPFDPANNPTASIGASPLPLGEPATDVEAQASVPPMPTEPVLHPVSPEIIQRQFVSEPAPIATNEEDASPIDAFMQPHTGGLGTPEQQQVGAGPQPADSGLPPVMGTAPPISTAPQPASPVMPPAGMPPLPPPIAGAPTPGSTPPGMPPLPPLPSVPGQEQGAPFQPQTSPEFMQSVNQSQNPWTESGQDIAAKQAAQEADRQQRMSQLGTQYDAAVDQNRVLQGLPPINSDPATFPLPPQRQ